jgi:hypothetical protein
MLRWRHDKGVADIDTLDSLRALVHVAPACGTGGEPQD